MKRPADSQLLLQDSQPLGPFGRRPEYQWAWAEAGKDINLVENQHKIGPAFTDMIEAGKYGDYLRDPKGHPYTYPTGAV